MHVTVSGVMKPRSCICRMPLSLVAPQTPAWVVTGQAELARHLERRLLGEGRVAGDVEGQLHAHQVVARVAQPLEEAPDGRVGGPLPRAGLDVAVGEHEPARHRAQRVEGGLGVLDALQVVRPVDRRRHAGVEGLDRGQPVARGDVLRAELLAVLEVVPDEVLGERPVGAVAAHRGLPHVPVGVDHPGHDDAAGRVDLPGPLGDVEGGADGGDPPVDDQDVGVGQHAAAVVHRQHGAAAQDDGPAGLGVGSDEHRLLLDVVDTCPDGRPHQRPRGAMRSPWRRLPGVSSRRAGRSRVGHG